MIDERVCLESPVFPIIMTVTLLIEYQRDRGSVYGYIFPFTGENMAVTRLRHHRWRKGIHGNSLMNRRLGAGCFEQCPGEKERGTDVS